MCSNGAPMRLYSRDDLFAKALEVHQARINKAAKAKCALADPA